MVMNWLVRCTAFTRKRDHGALQLRDVELLHLVVLTARLQDMPPPGIVLLAEPMLQLQLRNPNPNPKL
jgi:hypothetical protein